MYFYIQKVAFEGYGTTGTGSDGSWYNSGIDISRLDCLGGNVTIDGGSPVGHVLLIGGDAVVVSMAVWAAASFLLLPAVPVLIATALDLMMLMSAGQSNPDQANYQSTDTSASAYFNKNGNYLFNASCYGNRTTFSYDVSKPLSYAFKIWGRVVYHNWNGPVTQLDMTTPAVYLVIKNQ